MNVLERLTESRFLRFAIVGGTGFFVNEAVLFLAIRFLHLGPYAGGIFAFLITVTFTWWGNRTLTFRGDAAKGTAAVAMEWFKFVAANTLGFVANYTVYALLVTFAPAPFNSPYLALAAGTLVGLIFNFTLSKHYVFINSRA
ncbi:MAG TPA: GtrA family protein [Rhizomicrobium sp.]|nr:GtrA family protein [Rhizomicrobium sp.]